ncbi:MAG: alcohol dehydrogenase catalytic domain-containing protein [Eggerthellaceae bacterium]|nr:alcohol dehydrogenase catalytic domain-containing protein [Eggerthellaceae bacterium]
MKCSIYSKPHVMSIEERPDPVAGPDQVVVKVERAGICGSDVTAWIHDGTIVGVFPDMEWGHEFSGIVEQVGGDVEGISVGDRVWVNPLLAKELGLMMADMCGGFSEKVLIEKAKLDYNIYKLPDSISLEHAALIEPFCVGTHGKNKVGCKVGEHVVIYGAGPIGLCALSGLVGQGVKNVVVLEQRAERLALIEEMGGIAIDSSDPKYMKKLIEIFGQTTSIYGVPIPDIDVFIDCAGATKVIDDILSNAKRGARISIVANSKSPASVFMGTVMTSELEICGSSGYNHDDITEVIGYLANKSTKIDKIITHRFKYDELEHALDIASSIEAQAVKVIVEY